MGLSKQMKEAILACNKDESIAIAKQAISSKVRTSTLMQEALIPAISELGHQFIQEKLSLPVLVLGAKIVQETLEYLIRNSPADNYTAKATMVIGAVVGDIYFPLRIQLITAFFEAHGIHVVNLGGNVPVEKFLEAAQKQNADIIGISTYVTTAFYKQKAVIDHVKKMGVRDKYIIVVGGTALPSPEYAEQFGADVISLKDNAEFYLLTAIEKTKQVLKEKLHIIL